jgi:hypothetical protein
LDGVASAAATATVFVGMAATALLAPARRRTAVNAVQKAVARVRNRALLDRT